MSLHPIRCLSAVALALASSCASSRWYDYGFSPAPLEAEIQTESDSAAEVRALVSILGVARGEGGKPDSIEVRMRLENLGTTPVKLLTDSFSLCSADLQVLGPPTIVPSEAPILANGQIAMVDLVFPLPGKERPSDLNLRGLNLRWTVSFDEHHVTTGANFVRTDWRAPYDDYPRVHAGAGVAYSTTQ